MTHVTDARTEEKIVELEVLHRLAHPALSRAGSLPALETDLKVRENQKEQGNRMVRKTKPRWMQLKLQKTCRYQDVQFEQ